MKQRLAVAVAVCAVMFGITGSVMAQEDHYGAHLSGVQEVPPVYSFGHGFALFGVDYDQSIVWYSVIYFGMVNVTHTDINFGTAGVNGGIIAFLCSNLFGKPAGVQNCPNAPGLNAISGTLTAADVGAGAAGQGINAGDWNALATAISTRSAYVNVHTEAFPGGEIRGPLSD